MADLAGKELRLHRYSTVMIFCLVSLLLLALAVALPRSYTSTMELRFDGALPGIDGVSERLRARFAAAGVSATLAGNDLVVDFSAPDAQAAYEKLNTLLAEVVREEIGRLREDLNGRISGLGAQLTAALERQSRAEKQLNEASANIPEGGEAALGARIGQLQGELDALGLEIADTRELIGKLGKRLASSKAQIAALQPALDAPLAVQREIDSLHAELLSARTVAGTDAARLERLESEIDRLGVQQAKLRREQADAQARIDKQLLPLGQQLGSRILTLRDELAIKEKRKVEMAALLGQAREKTSILQRGNQSVREFQREYNDAVALKRQLDVQLQAARLELSVRATAAALPFRSMRRPSLPSRPDGLPAWVFVLLALAGGALAAAVRVLGAIAIDDRVRLAETVAVDVEVPVLAVIPDYQPRQAMGKVRWRVVAIALFCAATLAAHLLFLLLMG